MSRVTHMRQVSVPPSLEDIEGLAREAMHPETAAARNIAAGDWVSIHTPNGTAKARARFDEALDPQVVCGQHGWWQDCPELDAPGYPVVGPETANYNLVIGHDAVDPVSGSVPMRAYLCELRPAAAPSS